MRVGARLVLSFLGIAALTGGVGLVALRSFGDMRKDAEIAATVDTLLLKVSEKGATVFAMASSDDLQQFGDLAARSDTYQGEIEVLTGQVLTSSELGSNAELRRFLQAMDSHHSSHKELLRLHRELLMRQDLFGESDLLEKALRYQFRSSISV